MFDDELQREYRYDRPGRPPKYPVGLLEIGEFFVFPSNLSASAPIAFVARWNDRYCVRGVRRQLVLDKLVRRIWRARDYAGPFLEDVNGNPTFKLPEREYPNVADLEVGDRRVLTTHIANVQKALSWCRVSFSRRQFDVRSHPDGWLVVRTH